jgi:type IV pilus assembly protein PilM
MGMIAKSGLHHKLFAKTNDIVVIELGARTSKAAHVRREGDHCELVNYVVQELPPSDPAKAVEALAAHLQAVRTALGAETHRIALVLTMKDTVMRRLELPPVEVPEMRRLLKSNSKHFFQQDFTGYEFDCFVLPPPTGPHAAKDAGPAKKKWVLVGGAKTVLVEQLSAAAKAAHLELAQVTLTQISLVDAAALALPPEAKKEVVALVDIGFQTSTISFLVNGELGLTRVVSMGGDKLTQDLAAAFNIPYQVAEGLKTVMPDKVQEKLNNSVAPLAQDLKAAIDFFESQEEKKVAQVLVCGGTSRSDMVMQGIQNQLGIPCQKWDGSGCVQVKLEPAKAEAFTKDAPLLVSVLGTGVACLQGGQVQINFVAEEIEAELRRRRDPVRRVFLVVCLALLFMLLWAAQLATQLWVADSECRRREADITKLQTAANEVVANSRKIGEMNQTLQALEHLVSKRFAWVLPLDALRFTLVDDIQVVHLALQQSFRNEAGSKAGRKPDGTPIPAVPAGEREVTLLSIKAKNTGQARATDGFIEAIVAQPYFASRLRKPNPVRLLERLPSQPDPLNPARSFFLFTIECAFAERAL